MKHFLETARGPEFVVLFGGWFLLCWSTLLALRRLGGDHPLTTVIMLALFESAGVARYLAGSAAGLQRWTNLFLMMVIGALFFVLRAEQGTRNGSGGGGTSSSSCSTGCGGCGSGGCGGGGCGGCGGS